jgi:predicted metal-dependent phosphoesterase TrpH/glycosyltransferase involved in cell wall biosynthesis
VVNRLRRVAERLVIAQVSPFAWEARSDVGEHVSRVGQALAARGHRVIVIAPSQSAGLVRDSRRALRAARGDAQSLLARAEGKPLVLGVGEVLPFSPTRRRAASLPVDVARTIEEALQEIPFDVVHVHEPFAPSAASAALRHSRGLNVATFHAPTERTVSTQLGKPLSQLLFSRLDARIASYAATRELMHRFFPGDYELVAPAADPPTAEPARVPGGAVRLGIVASEERAALRTFLRALRGLPEQASWEAVVLSDRPLAAPATLGRRLSERVRFIEDDGASAENTLAELDVLVLASEGARTVPQVLVRALVGGVVPVTSRLAVYEELLGDGAYGLEFEAGDVETLTAQLMRLTGDPAERARLRAAAAPLRGELSFERLARDYEQVYRRLVARRHDVRARPAVYRRVAERPLIDADLHMHTDHSNDCATPVEVLLAEARARGLRAIAITDHNEISGALEAREKAKDVKVIVGEEVKTAGQGEVIGLFIEELIPRGLTLRETVREIHRQGGIVYVPHPFDRLHSVPDYEHLLSVLDEIDAIEVFNPRIAISEFNEEAVRFAAKYRIPAGAGSDAHVPQGLGSVRLRMHDFSGPEEFLESLRAADVVRNPASLLYVQALKFLQTRAMPEAARRASRDRRLRRATRRP